MASHVHNISHQPVASEILNFPHPPHQRENDSAAKIADIAAPIISNPNTWKAGGQSERLEAFVDVLKAGVGLLSFIANKIAKFAIYCFRQMGFLQEVKNEALSKQGIDAAARLSKMDRELSLQTDVEPLLVPHSPPSIVGQSGMQTPIEDTLFMIHCCMEVVQVFKNQIGTGFELDQSKLEKLSQLITPSQIDGSTEKNIKKCFTDSLSKEDKARFQSELHKMRGKLSPASMSHEFKIKLILDKSDASDDEGTDVNVDNNNNDDKDVTTHIKETVTSFQQTEGKFSSAFLVARNPEFNPYEEAIAYNNDLEKHGGIRPHEALRELEVQATTTNGWVHSLEVEDRECLATYRSGAFTVHDGSKVGLDGLKNNTDLSEAQKSEVVRKRTDLTVAQALPKIAAAIKAQAVKCVMENKPLPEIFLHSETSYLSDRDNFENVILQDMKGAIDFVRDHVKVKFTNSPDAETVNIEEGTNEVVMTLYVPRMELSDVKHSLCVLFFSQGVNEQQAFSQLLGRKGLQDSYNEESLQLLEAYAANNETIEFNKLKSHFSEDNFRKGKDVEGMDLISTAVRALGGTNGIVCTSGKDRTAIAVCRGLAREAIENASDNLKKSWQDDPDAKAKAEEKICEELLGACSYRIGKINTGEYGYAINEIQSYMFPKGWTMPVDLMV